jgi:hypothetical protein
MIVLQPQVPGIPLHDVDIFRKPVLVTAYELVQFLCFLDDN